MPAKKIFCATGKFPRSTPIHDMNISFEIPYMYNYITNYAGNKPKAFNIMRIYMFVILDKANPDTENVRDLKLAVVRCMTVQVIKFVFQPELLCYGIICCTKPGLKEA
jgi:hypothetical protein